MEGQLPGTISHPNSCGSASMFKGNMAELNNSTSRGSSSSVKLRNGETYPVLESTNSLPLVHTSSNRQPTSMKTPASKVVATTVEVREQGGQTTQASSPPTQTWRESPSVTLTQEDMQRYEKAFRLFDHDGAGFITCGELARVMRSLGMDPDVDELHYMVSAADLNGTGTVEFEEFVLMMKIYIENHHEEEDEEALLRKVFQVFDRTNDGYISVSELRSVMKQLGETLTDEELNLMLKCADTNGDGTITFEEFRRICAADLSKIQILQ